MDNSKDEGEERGIGKDNSKGMKTEEAIEFVKKHNKKEFFYTWERKSFKDIIALLKRGEKFKKMCNELIDVGKNTWQMWMELKLSTDNIPLKKRMNNLERKYFPKESNK